MKLYLNGELLGEREISESIIQSDEDDVGLSSPGEPLDGIIDEPAIYNRALTDQEIKNIYDAGKWGKYL